MSYLDNLFRSSRLVNKKKTVIMERQKMTEYIMNTLVFLFHLFLGTARGIVVRCGDMTVMGRIANLATGLEVGSSVDLSCLSSSLLALFLEIFSISMFFLLSFISNLDVILFVIYRILS